MTQWRGKELGFFAAGVVIGALVLFLLQGRYTVVPAGGSGLAYRLDRWTGGVETCPQCAIKP